MKRPLPTKSVYLDFFCVTFKQLFLAAIAVCLIFYGKDFLNNSQISNTTIVITVLIICLCCVLPLFFMKSDLCQHCLANLFKDCAFCHNCGTIQDKLKIKKPHSKIQKLSDKQIKAYLNKAIQSNTMKSFYHLSYLISFIVPALLAYLLDIRYIFLIFPFFLISGYIIAPLKHALWKRCPYCAHQTIFSDSQYNHQTYSYCSNCGKSFTHH